MQIFKNKITVGSIVLKLIEYVKYQDTIKIISKALAVYYDGCDNIREHDRTIRQLVFDAKYSFVTPELRGVTPSQALDYIYSEATAGNQRIKGHPLFRAMIQVKDVEIRSIRYILKTNQ